MILQPSPYRRKPVKNGFILRKYNLQFKFGYIYNTILKKFKFGYSESKTVFWIQEKNIDQITVSSSEDKIERKDLEKVNAYFIKTQKLKVSDYGAFSQDIQKDDTFLWSLYDQQTHEVTFKTLIGNSYTFQYEEQDNESYELALNVLKDENDTFSIGDIILKAKIKYLDGTVENKKIKIAANDDISSGLQMKIL